MNALLLAVSASLEPATAFGPAGEATYTITSEPEHAISPNLYSIFFETEINFKPFVDAPPSERAAPDSSRAEPVEAAEAMAAAVEEGVGAVGGTTEKDASEEPSLLYSLYAVLLHKGTLEKGHYFALIRDVEQNVWHRFDDDRVTRLDAEQLRRELRRAYGEMIRS